MTLTSTAAASLSSQLVVVVLVASVVHDCMELDQLAGGKNVILAYSQVLFRYIISLLTTLVEF